MTDRLYEKLMAFYRDKMEEYEHARDEVWIKYINSNRFKLITNYKLYRTYLDYTLVIKEHQKWIDELSEQHN